LRSLYQKNVLGVEDSEACDKFVGGFNTPNGSWGIFQAQPTQKRDTETHEHGKAI